MPGQPQNILLLAALSPQERTRAQERYRMLQPCVEHDVPLTHVARHHGIPLRTAQRWLAQYRRDGLFGLARRERRDRGHPHGLPPELTQMIEGLALRHPPPTVALVHRQVREVAGRHGWAVPNYKRVYRVVKHLDPALVTLAHDGSKTFRTTYDLLYRREAEQPSDIWQADHTLLDVWVRENSGPPVRPWLTVIMDDYSRAIAGFRLSFHAPSTMQTALTLRQAMWRKPLPPWKISGIPVMFYTDHGRDFTSDHLEQVSADLHMGLVFSEPGMPRGRGKIERFFRTVNQMLLCGLPGYTPAGLPPAHAVLTVSAFEAELQRFILDEYHQRPHSETGEPPQARWEGGGFLPRLPESLEHLDLLLLTVAKSRQVRPDGIHFQGLRYLDLTLAAYVAESVIIRYDPRDMAEIRIFHRDRFLCRAICAELAGETVALRDIIQARNRRRRDLRHTLQDRSRTVEALLKAHRGDPPGNETAVAGEPAITLESKTARVGFVHAFRPLSAAQVRELLHQKWLPSGVALPGEGVTDEEALAAIIRVTGGNFRLLHRLLTQIARLVEIKALQTVTNDVVEAARESLVIGTS
jgi:putative transposase